MTDRLGLPLHYRKELEALLRKHVPDAEVWAYGSRVNGRSHEASDLDLVLRGPDLEPLGYEYVELLEALEQSNIPILVQARDWARLPESFHREIEGDYVVLQGVGNQSPNSDEWQEVALGDLVDIEHGYAFKGQFIADEPHDQSDILLTPGNFAIGGGFKGDKFKYFNGNTPEGFVLCPDDLLVTMTDLSKNSDTLGYPALVPSRTDKRRYLHNQRLGKIQLKGTNNVEIRYLYYVLCSRDYRNEILASSTGTTVKHTSPERIQQYRFLLPPLPEQRRIAHILGALDDKIELNWRMNQTLEAMARAIFQDWFVDFGPVRAKLEGRDPYLPPELWSRFPDRLVASELGEIPEGWEVKTLDEIADYRNGLALQKFRPAENEERLPVVKIAQLRAGKSDGSEWAKASVTPDCIIDDGDVVFSWSGSLLIKVWCGGPAALNQHLFKVTSRQYPRWFFLHCTESHLSAFQAIAAGKTTTMGHIKREHLREAKCAVPDTALLTAVDGILAEHLSKTVSAGIESRTLAAQRDALLPKLVSGELRVGRHWE